jgi:hypothetical protein
MGLPNRGGGMSGRAVETYASAGEERRLKTGGGQDWLPHKGWAAALAVALAAVFLGGLVALFTADFAGGQVYPEYSTLRADPDGAKLLFESLARLPGLMVTRNFMPLQNLEANGSTVALLGLRELDPDELEKLAGRGNRVVAALREDWRPETKESDEIFKQWQVRIAVDHEKDQPDRLYFSKAQGWNAMESSSGKLVAIEREFGRGTVALLAASSDFSNESAVEADRLPQVTAALGASSRIVFDESHLGIAESGSVVGLARRFRMMGLAAGLAIVAALFIWRNSSSFPVREASGPVSSLTGRTSAAGLVTLLHKHVPTRALTAACWQEWLAGRRREFSPERVARAEAIARSMADRPLEAAREIHAALHSKGAL